MSDILVLNAGSSSIKFSIFMMGGDECNLNFTLRGEIEGIGAEHARFWAASAAGQVVREKALSGPDTHLNHNQALAELMQWIEDREAQRPIIAAGHRVVHGGVHFATPVQVDQGVLQQLDALIPLAPLHQPHNLAAIRALAHIKPDLPQVACFDTAYHRTQPSLAQAFALPRDLTEGGVHRYGFHGLSYEYIASVLPEFLGELADGRVVVAHLGNGASMCAMLKRKSVATTMGFTALEGLPMGTRCGALDPGVVLYLQTKLGMDVAQVTDLLYHRSGLLGVSGISNDMRTLLASHTSSAAEAIDLFIYRIGRELGSLAAALGGLDALVFTGGISEHAAPIRARVGRDAAWLGVRIDEVANRRGDRCISPIDSAVPVYVIPTNEELVIARHTYHAVMAIP